jgi:NAD(P)-dependent dehydrogenase (short-subunit alcohol dehydrogenase family)
MASARKEPLRILLTGAGRGLGLEFTRQWLKRGDMVFALARRPDQSAGLTELSRAHAETLRLQPCDVADDASVETARHAVEAVWPQIDIVLNNAGIYGRRDATLETLDLDDVRGVLEVNTLGPLRITRAFLPLLRKGRAPKLAHITSLMGSLADNSSGGAWAYRISKTALNMVARNIAHEVGPMGIVSVVLHPGWVKTDMGGPRAPLPVAESIASLIATIDALKPPHNGAFLDREGKPVPW